MEIIGPKYPFEPLPPPDKPSMRGATCPVPEKARETNSVGENNPRSNAVSLNRQSSFKEILNDKSIELRKETTTTDDIASLTKVAEELEAFFIYSLLKNFDNAGLDSGLFPKAAGSDMFMDMFFEGVAENVAKTPQGFGLKEMILSSYEEQMMSKVDSIINERSMQK